MWFAAARAALRTFQSPIFKKKHEEFKRKHRENLLTTIEIPMKNAQILVILVAMKGSASPRLPTEMSKTRMADKAADSDSIR